MKIFYKKSIDLIVKLPYFRLLRDLKPLGILEHLGIQDPPLWCAATTF